MLALSLVARAAGLRLGSLVKMFVRHMITMVLGGLFIGASIGLLSAHRSCEAAISGWSPPRAASNAVCVASLWMGSLLALPEAQADPKCPLLRITVGRKTDGTFGALRRHDPPLRTGTGRPILCGDPS
jgi:hypothetical protein